MTDEYAVENTTFEPEGADGTRAALERERARYEALETAFEAYKAEAAEAARQSAVRQAYRDLLMGSGLTARRADAVLKVTDLQPLQLDEEGRLQNEEAVKGDIAEKWGDLITPNSALQVPTPPTVRQTPGDAFIRGFDDI